MGQVEPGLLELTPTRSPDLEAAWRAAGEATLDSFDDRELPQTTRSGEQYLDLVTCRDEEQQVELLGRFRDEGLECKALVG